MQEDKSGGILENEVVETEETATVNSIAESLEDLKNRVFKFYRGFRSRLVQSTDDKKGYYLKIRNFALSYKKIKSRITWKCDKLSVGRNIVGKLGFRGKTLCMYVPFSSDSAEAAEFGLEGLKGKDEKTPTFLRITDDAAAEQATKLIAKTMESLGHTRKVKNYEPETIDGYEYETTETLLNKGHIILSVMNHRLKLKNPAPEGGDRLEELRNRVFRFERSYLTKLYQSTDDKKDYYVRIKNAALKYRKSKSRTTWKFEKITCGRNIICKIVFRGKTLCVNFPFGADSEEAKEYKLTESRGRDEKTPTCLRITGEKQAEQACELISRLAERYGSTKLKKDFEPETVEAYPYITTETLLNRKLIKLYINHAMISGETKEIPPEVLDVADVEELPEGTDTSATHSPELKEIPEGEDTSRIDLTGLFTQTIKKVKRKLEDEKEWRESRKARFLKNIHISAQRIVDEYDQDFFKEVEVNDGKFEYKKEYYLRAIDENWVNAIEEVLPVIVKITRNPGTTLEEQEEVVQAFLAKKVTSRSVQYLLQHVEMISEIKDEEVIPSRLLNVYMEDTIKTYENKFLNTLIMKLFVFVNRRYELVKKEMSDEVRTSLTIEESFSRPETHTTGKIQFHVEYSEPPKEVVVLKNYTFTTDLWKRVEALNKLCLSLVNSNFCFQMGKTYIRPPVMKTNALLKNKDLHQCLLLWQYIEGYESAGYKMLIHTEVKKPAPKFYDDYCMRLTETFNQFVNDVRVNADSEVTLDDFLQENIVPKIVDKGTAYSEDDFDVYLADFVPENGKPVPDSQKNKEKLSAYEKTVVEAVEIALEADRLMKKKKKESD